MSSLKSDFEDLLGRVKAGRDFKQASFEPIYYLVFSPESILEVKRQMFAWKAKLKKQGWTVQEFSISEAIDEILENARLKKIWLAADRKNPQNWDKTNKSLANALENGALQNKLESVLEGFNTRKKNILLVTDLEALHPYLRIGSIESQLQGKFTTPTVFFYPGTRTGKTRLKFLGFYPEDGNYRSVHVGG